MIDQLFLEEVNDVWFFRCFLWLQLSRYPSSVVSHDGLRRAAEPPEVVNGAWDFGWKNHDPVDWLVISSNSSIN